MENGELRIERMKKKLKDVCTFIGGGTPSKAKAEYWNGGIPWASGKDLQGYYITETIDNISAAGLKNSSANMCEKDDLILATRIAPGRASIAKIPVAINQDLKIVKSDMSNEWLKYFFKSKESEILQNSGGTTVKGISLDFLGKVEIPIISHAEQQKIAAELDTIQSAIDNKKQQLSLLDEAVKSKFVEMFGENPVESGKWKVEKIASVVDKNILSVKKKFQKTDTIKYVDISAIDNISNVVTGFTEYVLLEAPSRAQQVINQNDILISTVRPNLRNIAINPFNDNFMVGSSGFCVLRVNDLCNAKYLFYCVLNDDFTNAMVDLTTGAAYPAIKDSDILAYPIALPPLDLQNQFASFVQKIDKSKSLVKQQIADLQELLDSKMQQYFA